MNKYIPKQGDIVNIDSYTYLVVSNNTFNERTGNSIVCLVSPDSKDYPTHYNIEYGYVLCESIKSINYKEVNIKYIETISGDDLSNIIMLINACIEE